MDGAAILLILVSCVMHAGWNLLIRHGRSERAAIERMLWLSVAAGALPALAAELLLPGLPARAWWCVLGSGACCGVYYYGLAQAYRLSDFTVVYPVARSLPVLLVAGGDVLRGRWPAPAGWLGMMLVVVGCFLAPLHSFRDIRPRRYLNRAAVWMLLTALGTVGYTLLDKLAAEAVAPGPLSAARYGYAFFLFSWLTYAALIRLGRCRRENQRPPESQPPPALGRTALAAGMNFGAYWLVLWAYQLARRASYVVALRQCSVVLGVVAAFALYRERGWAVRLTGTALITAGLVLITALGH